MRTEDGLDVATLNRSWLLQTVDRDTTKKNTLLKKTSSTKFRALKSRATHGELLHIRYSLQIYTCYAVNSGEKIFRLVRYNPVRYVGVRMY